MSRGSRFANGAPRPRGRALVGISLYHSVGDRDRAVDQLNATLAELVNAVHTAMGSPSYTQADGVDLVRLAATDPAAALVEINKIRSAHGVSEHSKFFPLWHDTVSPLLDNWNKFFREQSSWTEFSTNWDEYEHWSDRLERAWGMAKAAGIKLGSFPGKLPKTFWDAAGSEIMSTVKVVAYGALGLGGAFVVAKLVEAVRGK